jgi:hypothetical protein
VDSVTPLSQLLLSLSFPTPLIMQSFIGYVPVSTRFGPDMARSLVPIGVGHALGRSSIGQRFVEALMAEYTIIGAVR